MEQIKMLLDNDQKFQIYHKKALSYLEKEVSSEVNWDLVFIDPPYEIANSDITQLCTILAGHLVDDGIIVVERSSRNDMFSLSSDISLLEKRKYGETMLYFLELKSSKENNDKIADTQLYDFYES